MSRPIKIGFDYFPFDVDFFSDIRIRKLTKSQGGKAVTVYALLLCLIYKNGYYIRWDKELPFIISEQTGYEEVYIREVIKYCRTIGLFSDEVFLSDNILTSKGIQKRYLQMCASAKRKGDVTDYCLIDELFSSSKTGVSSEETRVNSEETGINSEETRVFPGKSTQRKVKERKEYSSKREKEKVLFYPEEKPLPDAYSEIRTNASWAEQFIMNKHHEGFKDFDEAKLAGLLDTFFRKLQNENRTGVMISDIYRHFSNWVNIQLKTESDERTKTDKRTNARTGGQDYNYGHEIDPPHIIKLGGQGKV